MQLTIFSLHAVISRNILNDEASSLVLSENAGREKSLLAELHPAGAAAERYDTGDLKRQDRKQEVLRQDDALKGNCSAGKGNGAESVGVSLQSPPAGGPVVDVDASKPAHADEM